MAPSLEVNDVATEGLPLKAATTQINGVPAVSNLEMEGSEKHDRVLKVFRAFIGDLCQQFNGGHPGYVCP